MSVKLLTEHQLEFLSLKVGCKGLSASTLVKLPYCWKSHVTAHLVVLATLKRSITVYTVKLRKFELRLFEILAFFSYTSISFSKKLDIFQHLINP